MGTILFSTKVSGMTAAEFDTWESRLLPLFSPALDKLASDYKDTTAQTFSNEHGGMTGETELSPVVVPAIPNPYQIRSTVRYGGHVAYVVDPIKSHIIESHVANALAHQNQPIRNANPFSPFGPVHGPIQWYQGGSESYSPDRTWYERHIPALEIQGAIALDRFGAVLQSMLAAQGFGMEYDVTGYPMTTPALTAG